jgi:uncharacterized protein (TIGR02246 family)
LQQEFAGVARILTGTIHKTAGKLMGCRKWTMLLAFCWSLGACAGWADEQARAQDEQAIRAAAQQYVEALDRGDAQMLTTLWLPDGDIVDASGQVTPARDVIAQEAKTRQSAEKEGAGDKREVKLHDSTIRFLTDDVAIEDGTVDVTPPNQPVQRGRFTAIWVRGGGQWRLATLREARLAGSATDDLGALDAMVGRWSGQAGKAKFDLAVRWSEKHAFLERKLIVTQDDHVVLDASQRIGIDPLDGQIKSWMHDSQGGHSESVWTRHGDAWIVQGTGVTPDGRRSVSSNTYTFAGPDTLVWKSTGSYSGGRKVPDFEIKLTRVAGVE